MTNLNIEGEIDEIFKVMQHELSEAWERYDGAEIDDLDDYGDLYDNAYHKAKQALIELVAEVRVDELKKWRTMVQRLSEYVPNPESLIEFDDRIAELSSNKQGGSDG